MRRAARALQKVATSAALALGISSCDGPRQPSASNSQPGAGIQSQASGNSTEGQGPRTRPDALALAAELGAKGAKTPGVDGALLLQRAASLRASWWRLEHQRADALEAIDLYKQAAARAWDGACEAKVDKALLEAEVQHDPALGALALGKIDTAADPECRTRVQRATAKLAAFAAHGSAGPSRAATVLAGEAHAPVTPLRLPPTNTVAHITQIHRYGAKDAARIVVELSQPSLFQVGAVNAEPSQEGPRLYVDVEKSEYRGEAAFEVGGVVRRVRIAARGSSTRIVLDLEAEVYQKVFYLPEPFRLVIDVSTRAPRSFLGADGRRPLRRVVLDPGHGGHDPGAIGPSGLREKDVTLDIARRAAPLIAQEIGIATLLTRDSDTYVALDERAAKANAFNADAFLSIHCNATEDGHSDGVMTFVLDSSKDAFSARIAARENAASAAAAAELATALSQDVDTDVMAESTRLGSLLQRATLAALAPSYPNVIDHGVKRAGFYVLAGAHMPAVLFEASFISNPRGEAHLNTADYRQKLADGIVNAVRAFRDGR